MKQLKLHNECSHDKLIEYGFRKYGLNYKLFLPLYTYKNKEVITIDFLASAIDHYIGYDVIDNNSSTLYFPYYSKENGANNLVLEVVKKRIEKIFSELKDKRIIMANEV